MSVDASLKTRAARVLPRGVYGHESTMLLPDSFPQFFQRAKGAYLWDADGRRYLDFMCAYGPNLLGYGDERVEAAAREQLTLGDVMTGPSPLMVQLAEDFVGMVKHADWAMFCKNGTDATTIAMMTARAQTGRRRIVVAKNSYHGAAPWCTPIHAGTLPEERAQHRCTYNDIESLERAVTEAGDDLAAIFATPFKHDAFSDQALPDPAYAKRCRELCDATGAMLVVDDVRAGFRLARDCSWSLVGVEPDLSCWGKSFANGQPISAVLGSDRCREGAAGIYVTGSFWFAAVPMAAAIATLRILRETDYLERLVAVGEQLRNGLSTVSQSHGFQLRQTGPAQMPQVLFEGDPDFRIGYAWSEAMVRQGFYVHPWHNMFTCAAMTSADIEAAIKGADVAFAQVKANRAKLQPNPKLQEFFAMLR